MVVLGVILARAGSKGLPDKCVRNLHGQPVITYTFAHAKQSRKLSGVVLSTDSEPAKELARGAGIEVIDRPKELATDRARVDSVARHAATVWEQRYGRRVQAVVLLYGNIPIRSEGVIDRAVEHLIQSGADSVRTVATASKQHPDWLHRLEGDRMTQFRVNAIYRRQDLEPLYYHDGAVVVVTRDALFSASEVGEDGQAFLGQDRRAIVQRSDECVDIDEVIDLRLAEAMLDAELKDDVTDEEESVGCAVRIGGRFVGRGQPCFIVAEAGGNHNGSVSTALQMIDEAADAGADAIKFQVFRAEDLVTNDAPTAEYQRPSSSGATERSLTQREMLSGLELRPVDFARIRDRCEQRRILFLATPFGIRDVDVLVDLNVIAFKVASTDLTNRPLLEALATARRPVILSTGASTSEEIHRAVDDLRGMGVGNRLILLHCVSCYPTPLENVNLRAIAALHRAFQVPCGLSDHTVSVQTGAWAVALGACVLEKHFTLDPTSKGPDHAMSLSPSQMREYVLNVRAVEKALGGGRLGMIDEEAEVRAVAGKSVVSATFIPSGTRLTRELLTIKRPGGGIVPRDLSKLIGRVSVAFIPSDTVLSWDMVR
ncbi:MAG: N-acetylneuraminate synthase family protein [Planctomycetota bacterium]